MKVKLLRAPERSGVAGPHEVRRLAVIRFTGLIRAVTVIPQLQEFFPGLVIFPALHQLVGLVIPVGRDAEGDDGPGPRSQQDQAQESDQRAPDAPAPFQLLLFPFFLHAPGFLTRAVGLVLHLAVQTVDDGLDDGLAVLGKLLMLVPPAAQAGGGAGGVGAAAQADPHRPLIAGIGDGVPAGQPAQHVQLPGGLQEPELVLAHLPRAPAPHGPVDEPDLFNDEIHTHGSLAVLDGAQHLKGAPRFALDPLDAFHLAGVLPLAVKAEEGRLYGRHGFFREVEEVEPDNGILRCGQLEMPQFHRAAQVDLHPLTSFIR